MSKISEERRQIPTRDENDDDRGGAAIETATWGGVVVILRAVRFPMRWPPRAELLAFFCWLAG